MLALYGIVPAHAVCHPVRCIGRQPIASRVTVALRTVMYDGGCPLREAFPEQLWVQVLEEAPQRAVCRQAVGQVDVLAEKLAPAPGEVGDLRGCWSFPRTYECAGASLPTVPLPCGRCTAGYGADSLRQSAFALSEDEGRCWLLFVLSFWLNVKYLRGIMGIGEAQSLAAQRAANDHNRR